VLVVVLTPSLARADDPPIDIDKHVPYLVGATPNQTVDIYRRAGEATGRPAIVMVHGGGFAGGSPDDLSRAARLAAEQGWVTFNLDYRATSQLGTDGQAWPAELDDVRAGVQWVQAHAHEYGADPARLSILGASAGGTLAGLAAADRTTDIGAAALWSAPTDLAALVPDATGVPPACGDNIQCVEFWRNPWVTNLFGCTPEQCPDKYATASLVDQGSALPPSFLANATEEIVPLDQAERLGSAVLAAGSSTQIETVIGSRHAQTYLESVWNETMAFLAEAIGVDPPEPIDFDDGILDPRLLTAAVLALVVGAVVAVALSAAARDRSRGASGRAR
jgi:acetyl esterase/lipase